MSATCAGPRVTAVPVNQVLHANNTLVGFPLPSRSLGALAVRGTLRGQAVLLTPLLLRFALRLDEMALFAPALSALFRRGVPGLLLRYLAGLQKGIA